MPGKFFIKLGVDEFIIATRMIGCEKVSCKYNELNNGGNTLNCVLKRIRLSSNGRCLDATEE